MQTTRTAPPEWIRQAVARAKHLAWAAVLGATLLPAQAQQLHSPKGQEVFGEPTATSAPARRKIRLQWDYPVEFQTTDLIFKLYHSTNLALPLRHWPLLTNVPGDWRAVEVFTERSGEFFVLTASNAYGESDFATR